MQQALKDKNWDIVSENIDAGYNDKRNPGLRKRRDYERNLFNTPVEYDGRRGWLNISNWKSPADPVTFEREGDTVRIQNFEFEYTED